MSVENKLFDPFEFLGFDSKNPNNITIKDLKKSYYTLALICHPDKGGNPEDMLILQNSYLYIKEQIELKDTNSKDYDATCKDFQQFMKEQSQDPPPFSKVYEDTQEWLREFNSLCNESKTNNIQLNDTDLLNPGYGEFMEPESDYNNNNNNNNNYTRTKDVNQEFENIKLTRQNEIIDYKNLKENSENTDENIKDKENIKDDINLKIKNEFKTEIIKYVEPREANFNNTVLNLNVLDVSGAKIDNFNSVMKNMSLCDYKEALSSADLTIEQLETVIIDKTCHTIEEVNVNYDKLLNDRKRMDKFNSFKKVELNLEFEGNNKEKENEYNSGISF